MMSEDIAEAVAWLSQTRPTAYVEISSKSGSNIEQLITLALESISPTFFTHSMYHEGPSLDMFRSLRQLGTLSYFLKFLFFIILLFIYCFCRL